MRDGHILVTGGSALVDPSTELYDPVTGYNKDGMLSQAETDAHHAAIARGHVAPRLTSAPHPTPASAFVLMDDNKDGYLTLAELSASDMLHKHFNAADLDKDGRLTPTEVDAHHAAMGTHAH